MNCAENIQLFEDTEDAAGSDGSSKAVNKLGVREKEGSTLCLDPTSRTLEASLANQEWVNLQWRLERNAKPDHSSQYGWPKSDSMLSK